MKKGLPLGFMLFNTVDEHESAGKYLVKNVAYCELKKNTFE